MDRLHVATLNILNLADRWPERLPLLLADMAALQPDLLGLQEVVYVMQQDRLIGAAGEGRYGAVRGWAGRPEYGNSLLVKEPLTATQVDRLDLGLGRVRRIARSWRCPAARRVLVVVTHLHHTVDGDAQRDEQAAALLGWLDGAPRTDATVAMGDFNADPAEPTYARMRAAGLRVGLRRGQRRGAGRHLAVRAPGAGHGHRRRPGLPRLHLGPRRGPRRRRAGSPSTGPDPLDPTLYPSDHLGHQRAPRDRVAGDAGPRPHPPARPSRRLAARPGEQHRGDDGRARDRGLRRARVRRPALVRRRPRGHPRRDARAGPGQPGPRRRAAGGGPRDARHPDAGRPRSPRWTGGRSSTSSSRARTTGPWSRCWRPAAARTCATPWSRRSSPRRSSGSAAWRRRGRAGSTARRSTPTWSRRPRELGCRGVSVWFEAIDEATMAMARAAGLEVAAWTVRRRADLRPAGPARGGRRVRGGRGARRLTHGARRTPRDVARTARPDAAVSSRLRHGRRSRT